MGGKDGELSLYCMLGSSDELQGDGNYITGSLSVEGCSIMIELKPVEAYSFAIPNADDVFSFPILT